MRSRRPLALLTALGLAGTVAIAPVALAAPPVQLLTGDDRHRPNRALPRSEQQDHGWSSG